MSAYAAIHVDVRIHPFFHMTISSMRSCNQNTGPTIDTNRLKFVVIIGKDNGSFEDNSVILSIFLRILDAGGVPDVGPGDTGGIEEESSSCGMKDIVGDVKEPKANEPVPIDGRLLDNRGEDGGDGFGIVVVILGAGRMTCGVAVTASDDPRRRVAPGGTSI